jgi:nickel/cobalt exporter
MQHLLRLLALALLMVAPVLVMGAPSAFAQAPTAVPGEARPPLAGMPARPAAAVAAQPAGTFDRAWMWLMERQRELTTAMTSAVRRLQGESFWSAAMQLGLISFLYGVFHAAGPGHGKFVISSYALANARTLKRGITVSFMAAFVQAMSAIAVVAVLAMLVQATSLEIRKTEAWLETASWGLIALLGAWLLWTRVTPLFARRTAAAMPAHTHASAAGHGHAHHASAQPHPHHDHGHHHHHGAACSHDHHHHAHDGPCRHEHHAHGHDHEHDRKQDHGHAHGHGHVHGPDCGHALGHEHSHGHAHAHAHSHAHAPAHSHSHAHTHAHAAGEACDVCGHAHAPSPADLQGAWSWKQAWSIAFAVGIRPCTGAIAVLLFSLGTGLLAAGIFATFTMAIGTAITVSILATIAVTSRDLAARLGGRESGWAVRVQTAAGIVGSLLVMLMGASFFFASLSGTGPL